VGRTSKQARITEFWSSIGQHYNQDPENVVAPDTDEYAAWVEAVRVLLPREPCDVLDVGTGTGFLAFIAASLGHRVTGVDLAEGMLVVARAEAARRGLRPRLLTGDAVAPDFPDASFDVVTNRHLLWTLLEPETAFANWRRLLRPGGYILAFDGLWAGMPTSSDDRDGYFERFYTPEVRVAIPAMHIDSMDVFVKMFLGAGFAHASARPTMSKFAIVAQTASPTRQHFS
jgi:ubiquinone/menaquinone biosynthesis C-methylase UbiE